MKLFTLIIATTCLLAISSTSFSQTSFFSLKGIETVSQQAVTPSTAGSIKFNLLGIADGIVKVKMFNQPVGVFTVQLLDANGKVLSVKEIQHTDNTLETVDFGKKFPGGSYIVSVINPDNTKTNQTIMLLM